MVDLSTKVIVAVLAVGGGYVYLRPGEAEMKFNNALSALGKLFTDTIEKLTQNINTPK